MGVTALTGIGFRVHAVRVTTCINLLGISLMLRDTDKLFRATSKIIERGFAQKRVYVVAISQLIDRREEQRKEKDHSPSDCFGAIDKTAAQQPSKKGHGKESNLRERHYSSSPLAVEVHQQPTARKKWQRSSTFHSPSVAFSECTIPKGPKKKTKKVVHPEPLQTDNKGSCSTIVHEHKKQEEGDIVIMSAKNSTNDRNHHQDGTASGKSTNPQPSGRTTARLFF
eukprot:CAMPEP_0194568558 /NCGR_PEP_ID=MMETSP0292-20121207/6639_1 /TAXON_ID=39354 /ORGANISM="Heterosigma akashiwo, Strain CCMP2393" /LENGTH=224 /DNA_ID=CAMNT_0039418659 /DNA_START=608 /DNA_END=1282 /DNA_ORIENTATION=+